jgi:hypothetical protein
VSRLVYEQPRWWQVKHVYERGLQRYEKALENGELKATPARLQLLRDARLDIQARDADSQSKGPSAFLLAQVVVELPR